MELGTGWAGQRPIDEWFVAFVDAGRNLWWHRFAREGFRHCFMFAYDTVGERWIVFDPLVDGVYLRALPSRGLDRVIEEIWRLNGTVLRAKCRGHAIRRPRLFATCVTQIVHILGLKGCAVWPHGLYRMLLRHGAEPAFQRRERQT